MGRLPRARPNDQRVHARSLRYRSQMAAGSGAEVLQREQSEADQQAQVAGEAGAAF